MCIKKNILFSPTNLNSTLVQKKFLNKLLYHKSYIRSNLLSNKKLKIVDHYDSSSVLSQETLLSCFSNQAQDFNGMSINSKMYAFTNLLNNSIKFNNPMYSFVGNDLSFIQPLDQTLSSLNQNENNFREILILNPIKGGFQCYFSGIFGFLPRSQANILFYDLANNFLRSLKSDSPLTGLNLFKKVIDIHKKFIFRFPLKLGKVSLYPEHFKNNFSNKKVIKKRIFFNSLNVVFLAQFDNLDK